MIPKRIILHHSATTDSGTVSWGAIRHYHTAVNGWRDIGYHFGVEEVVDAAGRQHVEVLVGRWWDEVGAHTRGQNQDSLGVCMVGNFDDIIPPRALWQRTVGLLITLCRTFHILAADVYGHREFAPKSCPGKHVNVERLRETLRRAL